MKILVRTKILTKLILVLIIGCVMGFYGCKNKPKVTIEALKERGTLVVLTDPTFYPYEYYNRKGKIVGIDMEIAQLIANKLGVDLDIRPRSFEGIISSLSNNGGDIAMAGMSLTPEKQDTYPHSMPYADAHQKFLLLSNRKDIEEPQDLAGKKIGAPIATTSMTCIRKEITNGTLKDTNTEVMSYGNTYEVIQALKSKHVDAVLLDSDTSEVYAKKDKCLKVLPSPLGEEEKYVFFYPKNVSDEVIRFIDNIITGIKVNGRLEEFRAKHRLVNTDESSTAEGGWTGFFLKGLKNTTGLVCISMILGIVVGVLIAFIRVQHRFSGNLNLSNKAAGLFVQIFRGTPLMLQMYMFDSLFSRFLSLSWPAVILAFGLNSGVYISEILRSSVGEVDSSQYEAARILGFSNNQTLKLVILPQAFRNSVPTLLNEFSSLLKDTSIASAMGIVTLVQPAVDLSWATNKMWPFCFSGSLYFLIILLISHTLNWIKRWSAAKEIRKEQTKYVKRIKPECNDMQKPKELG
ncbi:ABC transporter permease subunit [Clostridia bacterium]|nr:ABC transporter permease subunit [Clostridia bacterium]